MSSQANRKAEADNNVITLVMICIRYITGNNNTPYWMQSIHLLIFLNDKSTAPKPKRDIFYLFFLPHEPHLHSPLDSE